MNQSDIKARHMGHKEAQSTLYEYIGQDDGVEQELRAQALKRKGEK